MSIEKRFQPRAGGLARLRQRLREEERRSHIEQRLIGAVASLLVVAFVGVSWWNPSGGERLDILERRAQQARQVEVPTGDPRVHFYWVVGN